MFFDFINHAIYNTYVMKTFAQNHPIWFAILVFVAESLLAIPFVVIFKVFKLDIEPLRLMIPIAQSVFVLWVIYLLGWLKQVGFVSRVKNVHLLGLPLLLAFAPFLLYGTVAIAVQGVLFYTLAVLFTGISEEGLARGIILRTLLPKGLWVAILGAGVLFSVSHFSNLFFAEMILIDLLEVLLNTFGFAVLYGALFLRTLNIYPLMVLHTLHDFAFVVSGTAGPFTTQPLPTSMHIAGALISILFGVYLVRNLDAVEILKEMSSDSK